uniref:fibrillin-2-like n=1 Tax=Myxine glutinosa TaxID=7769 RepID=UPI00358F5836
MGGCDDVNECSMAEAPCSFGCANTKGGYQCGCPSGFLRAGQGHCVSSLGFGTDAPLVSTFGDEGVTDDHEDILSPDTCYECQLNGYDAGRRRRSAHHNHTAQKKISRQASLDLDWPLHVRLNVSTFGPYTRILQFTPALSALKHHIRYGITDGNSLGLFRLHHHNGVSTLTSKRRGQARPGVYHLKLIGIPAFRREELRKLNAKHETNYLDGERGNTLHLTLLLELV